MPFDDWDKPQGRPVLARSIQTQLAASSKVMQPVADVMTGASARHGGRRRRQPFGGWSDAIALAERLRCAVYSAPFDRGGFPEDHTLYQGTLRPSIAAVRETLSQYDAMLVVGAPVFRYCPYSDGECVPKHMSVFQVVDDVTEISRAPIGSGILADSAEAMRVLAALVPPTDRSPPPPRVHPPAPEPASVITNEALVHTLSLVH
ncbi:hypothetical protein [Methylobacterium sp. J-077]|uniref:hypothetical protein n=1 Tax=Methylobacterium sp. J-077 TaxID=2836656 RepID=UPI001FBBF5FB|nr:hypothetical protein [Methylobacterium sp. J-077]MCJ2124970.1 hypothetical protein [Methylobacterium sp. J-077]